jgi:ribosomal subunit interface protein
MSFPIIQFKSTSPESDEQLQNLVTQKFESLAKFVGDETDVKCEVEFEKETAHQSGRIYRVEANLFLAGKLHRAEATEMNFEKAIDEVRSELDKLLRRASSKQETMIKRGGRKIKEILKFGRS